jgi:hypothetical protein
MKRVLATLILIICLSFSVLAGHVHPSGGWCECGAPSCICDPGETPQGTTFDETANETQDDNQNTPAEELSLCIVAVLLFLRITARA